MKRLLTFLFLSVLLISLTACGGSSDSGGTTKTAEEPQKYEVGKEYTLGDVGIKLNQVCHSSYSPTTVGTNINAPEGTEYVMFNWSLLNESDKDIPISTENFSCYVDNKAVETSSATFMLPQGSFTGLDTLAAGRQFDGIIIYEIPTQWSTLEVEFKDNMFTDNKMTYEFTPDMVPNVEEL